MVNDGLSWPKDFHSLWVFSSLIFPRSRDREMIIITPIRTWTPLWFHVVQRIAKSNYMDWLTPHLLFWILLFPLMAMWLIFFLTIAVHLMTNQSENEETVTEDLQDKEMKLQRCKAWGLQNWEYFHHVSTNTDLLISFVWPNNWQISGLIKNVDQRISKFVCKKEVSESEW